MDKLNIGVPRNLEYKYGDAAKLDKTDKDILVLLSKQGRLSIADISKKLRVSRDVVKHRIRKLVKDEVIQGFVAVANPTKLGFFNYTFVSIAFQIVTPGREKQLIAYIKSHPHIIYAAKLMGKWDLHLEIYSKHNKHLDQILNDIRAKFSDIIKDMEIKAVIEEYKWAEFPGAF